MSYSVGQIHKYSVRLYPELERETGQDVGFRPVGNIRLATNRDRMDEYRFHAGVARTIGVRVEFLTPSEVRAIWPLCEVDGLVGAIVHPEDGYIQPADLTQAFARGARDRGAEIYRRTKVAAIERTAGGSWRVRTDQGDIVCEHVVSATGNHARQTGAMVGLDVPTIPVEHQYLVTEPHPDIVARHEQGLPEMGVLRESDASYYLREERGGLLLGPYEAGAPACFVDGPPDDFENDLFPEDLERLEPHIEAVVRRVPAFGEGRAQAGGQRTHPLHPGRKPPHRPRLGRAQLLAQRGPQLRHHRRGRRRLADRGMDRRGRAVDRHDGASTRAASDPTRPAATSRRRTRRPTPTSSPFITRTRSAPPPGPSSRRPATRV